MIRVLYTVFDQPFSNECFQTYLQLMPDNIQHAILRYRRWQDAHACLAGKLLLYEGLRSFGYPASLINDLQYTDHNRPYVLSDIDFNISHTDGLVTCALSRNGAVGIDVEKVHPVPINDFKNVWSAEEWRSIHEADDIYTRFFMLWTMKEAIVKAEGKGLSIPLPQVKIANGRAMIGNTTWSLQQLSLHPEYVSHIASANEMPSIELRQFSFN